MSQAGMGQGALAKDGKDGMARVAGISTATRARHELCSAFVSAGLRILQRY